MKEIAEKPLIARNTVHDRSGLLHERGLLRFGGRSRRLIVKDGTERVRQPLQPRRILPVSDKLRDGIWICAVNTNLSGVDFISGVVAVNQAFAGAGKGKGSSAMMVAQIGGHKFNGLPHCERRSIEQERVDGFFQCGADTSRILIQKIQTVPLAVLRSQNGFRHAASSLLSG